MREKNLEEDIWMHGVISAAILMLLVLFSYPSGSVKSSRDIFSATIKRIEYVAEGYRASRKRYLIEINIEGDDRTFKISGANYQEADHSFLKDSIRIGSVVNLNVASDNSDPEVYALNLGGRDVLDEEAVKYHRTINSNWALTLLGYCALIAVIKITIGASHEKTFKYILIAGVCLISLYYYYNYGMKYVTNYNFG